MKINVHVAYYDDTKFFTPVEVGGKGHSHFLGVIEYPETPINKHTYLRFGDIYMRVNVVAFNVAKQRFEVMCLVTNAMQMRTLLDEFGFVEQTSPTPALT